ncbi:MAG TPA: prepilin-type N-terminal cleavage/methylation domain-containing protein [Burkholderiaceae bacterium]|nr:prepilin-type N-terminal cleavage/methylation domain-containing protein [Burkholderiaceae bacterium]
MSGSKAIGQHGFTLLELLVVLILIAVVSSVISISATPDPRQSLIEQAERLGLVLSLASDEARIRQQPISWEGDLNGYRFVSEAGGERQLLSDDDLLHERTWRRPLTLLAISREGQLPQALLSRDAPALRLPIAREWVQPRWKIQLADGTANVTIDFDENGIGRVANP